MLQLCTPWGVRKVGSHKHWIVAAIAVQVGCLLLLPVAGLASATTVATVIAFGAVTCYWAMQFSAGGPWNTWMEELVPLRVRTRFFACRQRTSQICLLAGFVIGGLAVAVWQIPRHRVDGVHGDLPGGGGVPNDLRHFDGQAERTIARQDRGGADRPGPDVLRQRPGDRRSAAHLPAGHAGGGADCGSLLHAVHAQAGRVVVRHLHGADWHQLPGQSARAPRVGPARPAHSAPRG